MKKKSKKIETGIWWRAWRDYWTLKGIAKLFKVSDRTVARWLAEGLENHFFYDDARLQTAVKAFNEAEGQDCWRIHPLGVIDWLIERAAETGREAGLPIVVKSMAEKKRWGFFWSVAWDANPKLRDENPPPFSWKLVAEDKPLMLACLMGEWWLSGMCGKGDTGYIGGPFDIGAEEPEDWFQKLLADSEEDGEDADEDDADGEEDEGGIPPMSEEVRALLATLQA